MDGLTCTKKIRALEADGTIVRHVPIIAVTANARLEQIETALATGMVCGPFILSCIEMFFFFGNMTNNWN